MSNLEYLDPMFVVSTGNQVDVTVSDIVHALAARADLDCIGAYVEGFNDMDGLAFLHGVEAAVRAGKIVVFYKAGRTGAGRSAAKGHTASVAGDYDVCQAAVEAAGAIVTDTFKEFEQIIELATYLHPKRVAGKRIGAISNAGYEAVGMADTVRGARYQVEMPALSAGNRLRLQDALHRHRLDQLVDAKNPLDLTPMASDAAYEDAVRVFCNADEMDAVIVGCVPMTPNLLTTPEELHRPGSLAERLPRLFAESNKPLIFVTDCAGPYDELARVVRSAGVPVFRSADQAVRSVGRYLSHRSARRSAGESCHAPEEAKPTPSQHREVVAVGDLV
jgi:acyl-CoA synthetase (NDP forming)